jgi:hypothetical protein
MPSAQPPDFDPLEGLIDRTLRSLPARPAPPHLAARVHAELARRAALPWWRRGVADWPAPARIAFVVICVGLICLSVLDEAWRLARVQSLASAAGLPLGRLPWVASLSALWGAASDLIASLAGAIPARWLDAGALLAAATYAALLGLVAAAYRMLRTGAEADAGEAGGGGPRA